MLSAETQRNVGKACFNRPFSLPSLSLS
jgi:hypothetical protein